MRFGFIGPSYLAESQNVDCEVLINRFLEINEAGPYSPPPTLGTPGMESSPPTRWSAFMRPGKALMGSAGAGPGSCVVTADADPATCFDGVTPQVFAIVGTSLVAIAFTPGAPPGIVVTTLGTVNTQAFASQPGQNLPAQIIVINPNLIVAVSAGILYVAGKGITGSTLVAGGGALTPVFATGAAGGIATSVVDAGGAGYAVGDTGTVTPGPASPASYIITSVSGGAVTGFTITAPGAGYVVEPGYGTTPGGAQPGSAQASRSM